MTKTPVQPFFLSSVSEKNNEMAGGSGWTKGGADARPRKVFSSAFDTQGGASDGKLEINKMRTLIDVEDKRIRDVIGLKRSEKLDKLAIVALLAS